jgi:lipid-A-disaccharide synthase-like uncharacterized protein
MNEELRQLLYPLGFVSSLFFFSRFFIQWIAAEKEKRSVVPKGFWLLSLIGHLLLFSHSFIQQQFHVACFQSTSAVIAWRNQNLLGKRPAAIQKVFLFLALALVTTTLLFFAEHSLNPYSDRLWFRAPLKHLVPGWGWSNHILFHLFGWIGMALFASRFWVQWWLSEMRKESVLPPSFWWISLIGSLCSFLYFTFAFDPIHLAGPLFNCVVSIRNLQISSSLTRKGANA